VLVQKTLEPLGHSVEFLDGGFAEIASTHDWSGVDVVLCDRFLDDYDGAEILKWLSANAPHVRRVMLTGDSQVHARESCAEKLLIKPAYIEDIRHAVEDWQ